MAKICLTGQKWSTRASFLTSHLEVPKGIAIRCYSLPTGAKTCPDDRFNVKQTFTSISRTVAEMSVPEHKDTNNYSWRYIRQNAH